MLSIAGGIVLAVLVLYVLAAILSSDIGWVLLALLAIALAYGLAILIAVSLGRADVALYLGLLPVLAAGLALLPKRWGGER